MKRFLFLLLIVCGFSLTKAQIPPDVTDLILKQASVKLNVAYQDLCQDYTLGKCTITPVSPKTYKVSDGGGSVIILDLDDLL